MEKHFNNNLTDSTLLAMSDMRFTNDQLALSHIRHFDEQIPLARHLQQSVSW